MSYCKHFELKDTSVIKCPLCGNRTKFSYVAVPLEPGIFEMRIDCNAENCDWASEELLQDSGYVPSMSKSDIAYAVRALQELQNDVNGK